MRRLSSFLALALLAGCAGVEYTDNTAEVARDPRCIDRPANPDQSPAPWCQPQTGASWSSGNGEKVDFTGGKDD